MTTSESINICPLCGKVQLQPGETEYVEGSTCRCRNRNGTMWYTFPYNPQPTQLDRIEGKLDELLTILRRKRQYIIKEK